MSDKIEYPKGIIEEKDNIKFKRKDLINKIYGIKDNSIIRDFSFYDTDHQADLLSERSDGDFKNISFYLNDEYNWVIIRDSLDSLCLVPTLKKEE